MKIAYDAKRFFQNMTGLGNYSRTLLESFGRYFPQNEYHLFTPKMNHSPRVAFLKQYDCLKPHTPTSFWRYQPALWRAFGLKKAVQQTGASIFHGLSNELPWGIEKTGLKTIVSIHDVIFERYPEYYSFSAVNVPIYRHKFRSACARADKIVAVSQMTAQDVMSFYNVPKHKIQVVYQSCDPQFYKNPPIAPEIRQKILQKYSLPADFMLYVGTVNPRKNLLTLLKALRELHTSYSLAVIGEGTAYYENCKQFAIKNQLNSRVFWLKKPHFADFPAIYQSASLFLLPSYFEGFGIPIIEALHSGVPVLTSQGSCFAEAGGANSIYLPPDDVHSWVVNIQKVLSDSSLGQKMIHAGKQHALQFDEERIAQQWMNIYHH